MLDKKYTADDSTEDLLELIRLHIQGVQSGSFGTPSINALKFCGKLHQLLEEHTSHDKNI